MVGDVMLYSPLTATSPGWHNAVELAMRVAELLDGFPTTE